MSTTIFLFKNPNQTKKFKAVFQDDGSSVFFGQRGYTDYSLSRDDIKRKAYLLRHKKNENWTKSGIKTAGFLSRWLLWEKSTLTAAIKHVEQKFNVNIILK
jgi:hypothetical protein